MREEQIYAQTEALIAVLKEHTEALNGVSLTIEQHSSDVRQLSQTIRDAVDDWVALRPS